VEEKLRLREGSGASFFNAYGGSVGTRWMEFKRFVCASLRPEHADHVVEAARQTFLCFYEWLGSTSAIVRRP
jgi:heme oxygenase